MSTSQILDVALWCAHPLLQAAVAVVIWRRKLHKQFPCFFTYLICQIGIFAAIFSVRSHNTWFFWVHWTAAAVNAVLSFKIIHEIFLDVFRPYPTLKDLGTVIFKWAGVVMLLVAVVVAFSNSSDQDLLNHIVLTLQRSIRLVQFGLVLFLILFSGFLGVSRRNFSFGIALGFGLFAGIELLLLAAGSFVSLRVADRANMVVYNLSLIGWFGYALSYVASPRAVVNPLQTQRWEQSLSKAQNPVPADSLIPMFENMVERAITRSSTYEELPPSELNLQTPKAFSAASTGTGSKSR